MNKRKEKIKLIVRLAEKKNKPYYNLFSTDELYTMLSFCRKYDTKNTADATMEPDDEKVLKQIRDNHNERVKQLTPDELRIIKIDNSHEGDWQIRKAAMDIQERFGLNKKS